MKSSPDEVPARVAALGRGPAPVGTRTRRSQEGARAGRRRGGGPAGPETINGVAFLGQVVDGLDPKGLRGTVDEMKQRLGSGVAMIVAVNDGRASVAVGVTADLVATRSAVDLLGSRSLRSAARAAAGGPTWRRAAAPTARRAPRRSTQSRRRWRRPDAAACATRRRAWSARSPAGSRGSGRAAHRPSRSRSARSASADNRDWR